MMRRFLTIPLFLIMFLQLHGQTPVGSWSDHLIYNTAKSVAAGEKEVYASTGSSIIVYNKEFAELRKMSRIDGLTETGISTIGWSEENKTLIIAYTSTNLDLVRNNVIYNIPDISRKYIPGKKEINKVRTRGKYAYLASSFGIIVVDMLKNEIYDTWKPGSSSGNTEVWDVAFGNNKIYAATAIGVFTADLSNPGLAYFESWDLIDIIPDPSAKYTTLLFSGNKLYVNQSGSSGDSVYAVDVASTLFSFTPGVFNKSFDPSTDGFTISSSGSVRYYNANGSLNKTITSYGWGVPDIAQSVVNSGELWIADIKSGLVKGENMSVFKSLTLPGPLSNNGFSITSYNGKTIISAGSVDVTWNNIGNPLQLSIHEKGSWSKIYSGSVIDPMRSLIDPANSEHYFVTTWGGGLLEYQNEVLVKQYNASNSPLQTIIPGQPYVRVCGIAMDERKNIWITQTQVPGSIKILKPDGTWIVNPLTIEAPTIGDIIITRRGDKWIVLPRGNGLFILDDNNTPELFTDDRSKKMLIRDSENQVISFVYSIAEDLDGAIWVGTDQGPLVYYNPEKVFDEELKAVRPKVPRNDDSDIYDYLLKTETITSIAIDGANSKWIGTYSSGAYQVSPDGTSLLKHYDVQGSPILSNSIVSLAIDNKTGDIWFGTSKGIQSVRGEATAGEEVFTNVYTFPNPVREDYTGDVTITGLVRDSQIRITDISGNLVYETVSDGGQATWDLTTYNGKRVATGVYLVFCSSSDGSQAFVTKMLVIKK